MTLLIGFLTFILVVTSLFLILLVLVQLPKKEAGAGLAFGAGAVDTLIGAGSGNALTKMTKYTAGIFLGLAVLLSILNAQRHEGASRGLQQELSKKASAAVTLPPAQTTSPAMGTLNTNPISGALQTSATAAQTSAPTVNLTPQATPQTTAPANPPAQPNP